MQRRRLHSPYVQGMPFSQIKVAGHFNQPNLTLLIAESCALNFSLLQTYSGVESRIYTKLKVSLKISSKRKWRLRHLETLKLHHHKFTQQSWPQPARVSTGERCRRQSSRSRAATAVAASGPIEQVGCERTDAREPKRAKMDRYSEQINSGQVCCPSSQVAMLARFGLDTIYKLAQLLPQCCIEKRRKK